MHVELVALTRPLIDGVTPEDFSVYIARIGRVKDNPARLLRYLIKHAHWSPFEHTHATFKIVTSRTIARELLRHRSFTFQELSQRYELAPGRESIELRQQAEKNRQSSTHTIDPMIEHPQTKNHVPASQAIQDLLEQINRLYEQLLAAGVARECARFVLPECTTTTILMTGSIRSWIHFFAVRDHPDAQKEARLIAQEIKKIFTQQFPTIAQAAFATDEETKTIQITTHQPQQAQITT